MDYACISWYYGLTASSKKKLQVLQNKIARYILCLGPRKHIGQTELQQIDYLNVNDRVTQLSLNMVHGIYNGISPPYLNIHFKKVSTVHSYNTRSRTHNFVVPKVNNISANSFNFNTIKLWNSSPDDIKGIENKDNFKRAIKTHLGHNAIARENSDSIYLV